MYLETYISDFDTESNNKMLENIEKIKNSIINYVSVFENNNMDDLYFDDDNTITFNTLNNKAIIYINLSVIYPKHKVELCIRNSKTQKVLYVNIEFYELNYPDITVNKAVDYIRSYVDGIK